MSLPRRLLVAASVFAALTAGGPALTAEGQAFDPSRYPSAQIAEVMRDQPTEAGLVIASGPAFRARVVYSGDFRALASATQRFLEAWAAAMGRAEVPRIVQREVRIREAERDYWVAIQEMLVSIMTAKLAADEPIDVYLLYLGQTDGRHILVLSAFDHDRHP